ncbi:MAG: amidohydrolase [Chthoniobacterales bacterium]|nr:amidohydrolase [Chthoniobacterales bacterium]
MVSRMNVRLSLALFACSVVPLFAQQTPQQLAEAELPSLLTIYKELHAHPELSGKEEKTAAFIAKELRAVGCEVTEKVGKYDKPGMIGYGLVGVMKNGPGPTVLVRTDLDGLPVEEETGLPYASKDTQQNDEGKEVRTMHACGHDMHMSAFIGTARALAKLKDQWKGTIVFVGQPAEETGLGAKALLADGLYTRWPKPDFVLGLHDSAQMEAGKVGMTEGGYIYANVDSVDVTVRGLGGHGAYPHMTKDPVVLAAQIIQGWQTIVSREVEPIDSAVVTVGSIHAGTKHNIISDEVKMQLTVRSYKKETREKVLASIERIAKGMATAAGIPAERMPTVTVRQNEFTPATYNNPELTKRVAGVLKTALGADKYELTQPVMGGEDFSVYSLPDFSIPACMFTVGGVDAAKIAESKKTGTPLPSLHSSKFAPVPEPSIRAGVIGMTTAVLDLMKK